MSQESVIRRHEDDLRRAIAAHPGGGRPSSLPSELLWGEIVTDNGDGSYVVSILGDSGDEVDVLDPVRAWNGASLSAGDRVNVVYRGSIPVITAGAGGSGAGTLAGAFAGIYNRFFSS